MLKSTKNIADILDNLTPNDLNMQLIYYLNFILLIRLNIIEYWEMIGYLLGFLLKKVNLITYILSINNEQINTKIIDKFDKKLLTLQKMK